MAADRDQLNYTIGVAERHQRELASALAKMERRIIQLMSGAPLTDGQLFDLEWAVSARNELRQIVQEEYLEQISDMVADYAEVAAQAEAMLGTYSEFVVLDQNVVRQLQQLTFNGFEALGQDFTEVVAKAIYDNTLTGLSFADAVEQIRSSVDADLGRYANVALHDGLMDFNATINTNMGLNAGADKFKYYGPDDSKTRPHCDKYVGEVMTLDEIKEAWSGSWSGKRDGSPLVVRGGYNCRHHFRPVFE